MLVKGVAGPAMKAMADIKRLLRKSLIATTSGSGVVSPASSGDASVPRLSKQATGHCRSRCAITLPTLVHNCDEIVFPLTRIADK